jgi:hypothetical protein
MPNATSCRYVVSSVGPCSIFCLFWPWSCSDSCQFVPFRDYRTAPVGKLAKDTLAEIPAQVSTSLSVCLVSWWWLLWLCAGG